MSVAVQMGAEQNAIVGDFAKIVEAEDLEAAGIGEDGPRPGHEAVETAEALDAFVTGTKKQMVGVGEDNFRVEFRFQIALGESFDRGLCADGHEYRSFDNAMRGMQ